MTNQAEPSLRNEVLRKLFTILVNCSASIVVLGLFSWLLAIFWMLVFCTSTGPAIFSQRRVGQHQKAFYCLKLRTMYADTSEKATHQISEASITPVGKIFRRFRIDEIPQFINVLKGEMNVIGPRPCLFSQTDLIEARTANEIFKIKPGITGLAQINGVDMSDIETITKLDHYYMKHRSISLDFKILIKTISGKGFKNYNMR